MRVSNLRTFLIAAFLCLTSFESAADITLKTSGGGFSYLDDTGVYSIPAGGGGGGGTVYPNFQTGLNPDWFNSHTVRFGSGAIADGAVSTVIVFTTRQPVDLSTVGPLGLDTGTVASNTSYYFYALKNTAGTACTIVASTSATTGGVSYANLPGFASGGPIIQLPMAITYKSIGVPQFLVDGWGGFSPEIAFTDWDSAGAYDIQTSTAGTGAFITPQVYTGSTAFAPSTARYAIIQYDYRSTTGSGDLVFQDIGSANTQIIANVIAGSHASGIHKMLISSSGAFKVKNPTNTTLTLRCLGYWMSSN